MQLNWGISGHGSQTEPLRGPETAHVQQQQSQNINFNLTRKKAD